MPKKNLKTNQDLEQLREDLEDLVSYINDFNTFLPIAVCSVSPQGDITEINLAFEELTGWQPLEIIGESLKTIFLEQDTVEKILSDAQKKKILKNIELTLIPKDKKNISVNFSVSSRKDKKGNHIGYFASFIDITEIKKFQGSLEAKVQERTMELQKKVRELERFQKITVGRELKMIELKKEIDRLKKQIEKKE